MRLTAKDKARDHALFLRPNGDKNEAWAAPFIKQSEVHAVLDKLAAYEDAEEQGLLVRLPCKVGDMVWFYLYEDRYYLREGIYQGVITELKSVQRLNQSPLVLAVVEYEYPDPWYGGEMKRSEMHCSFSAYGSWVRFYLTREEAEAAMKGETEDV